MTLMSSRLDDGILKREQHNWGTKCLLHIIELNSQGNKALRSLNIGFALSKLEVVCSSQWSVSNVWLFSVGNSIRLFAAGRKPL